MRAGRWGAAGFSIVVSLAWPTFGAAPASPLKISGGDEILWMYRSISSGSGDQALLRFAFCVPGEKGALRFRPLTTTPIGGSLTHAAVRRTSLHIFFADGTHYRLRPPMRVGRPSAPIKNDVPAMRIPDGRPPLAMCGDDGANVIAVIVRRDAADRMAVAQAGDDTESPADAVEEAEAPRPKPARIEPASRFALATYAGNDWSMVSAVPTFFDDHHRRWLTGYDGQYHLFFDSSADDMELAHCLFDGETWSQPQPVPGVHPERVLAAIASAEYVALITQGSGADGADTHVRAAILKDGRWDVGALFAYEGASLRCPADMTAFDRVGDNMAVAMVVSEEDGEQIRIGTWPVSGGPPSRAPNDVPSLRPKPRSVADEQSRMLLATIVLGLLLGVAFIRRRESFLTDLPTPPGYSLCRLGRRSVAFAIDLAVVSAVAYPAFLAPWMDANIDSNADWRGSFDAAMVEDPDGLYWRWMAAAGLYVVYAIIFEAFFAATLGKLALQMRVADSTGGRCSLRAIILRNVLRFEFYPLGSFMPTAILVMLTRNRQRLGDLVAQTIVVEKVVVEEVNVP